MTSPLSPAKNVAAKRVNDIMRRKKHATCDLASGLGGAGGGDVGAGRVHRGHSAGEQRTGRDLDGRLQRSWYMHEYYGWYAPTLQLPALTGRENYFVPRKSPLELPTALDWTDTTA
jgi:hypothetical protein